MSTRRTAPAALRFNPFVFPVAAILLIAFRGPPTPAATIVDDAGTARNGKVGGWSSVVARGGQTAISYYCEEDMTGPQPAAYSVRFAWDSGGTWHITNVDFGGETSLARASNGVYHLVYNGINGVTWATGGGANWNISPDRVDTAVSPIQPAMVLDSAGRPHVAYFDFSSAGQFALKYTRWNGTAWVRGTFETVATNAWFPWMQQNNRFIAVDPAGRPHIVFANDIGDILYFSLVNGSWQSEWVATGDDASLAIGSDGIPRIAFVQADSVVFGYKSGGMWSFETVATGQTGISNLKGVCIALDSANNPSVCFAMSVNEDMYLASRTGGSWTVARIDGDGTPDPHVILGRYGTSVDIDDAGRPVTSYQAIDIYPPDGHTFRADLKCAGNSGSSNCISITSHPQSARVCDTDAAAFSTTATSPDPLSYQWQAELDPGAWTDLADGPIVHNGIHIGTASGAAADSMQINTLANFNADRSALRLRCQITAACGSTTTLVAELSVSAGPDITNQPVDATCRSDGVASMSVAAGGMVPIDYRWQVRPDDAMPDVWTDLSDGLLTINGYMLGTFTGTGTATLVRDGAVGGWTFPLPRRDFRCIVSDRCGSTASLAATLHISNSSVSITTEPEDQSACNRDSAHFSVTATGVGEIHYQWQVQVDATPPGAWEDLSEGPLELGGVLLGIISGPTDSTLGFDNAYGAWQSMTHGVTFRCRVSDDIDSAFSRAASLVPCGMGDLNCDGTADAADALAFATALLDPDAYAAQYPGCDMSRADANGDGVLDGDDVQGMVQLLMP